MAGPVKQTSVNIYNTHGLRERKGKARGGTDLLYIILLLCVCAGIVVGDDGRDHDGEGGSGGG